MVAQAPRTRTRKVAMPTTVIAVDVRAGVYNTSSSTGTGWYLTDVKAVTCTCKAGQDGFKRCKTLPYCRHMLAAKVVARALASIAPANRAATLRVMGPTHVKTDVVLAHAAAARVATPPAPAPAADPALALLECYPSAA